jgi:hypothetical protein
VFDQIVLRHSKSGPGLTLGEIAEALLFYRRVHIVLDPLSLKPLIDGLGPSGLLELLDRDGVSSVYSEDMAITQNYPITATYQLHSFGTATISSAVNETRVRRTPRDRLRGLLESRMLTKGDADRFVARFARKVPIEKYAGDFFIAGGIHKAASEDLREHTYITEAARRIVANTPGFEHFATNLRFDIEPVDKRFAVWTNIDFDAGNARRKQLSPGSEDFTESNILSAILDARIDLTLAAHYGSDFHTSAVNSGIVRLRSADLLRRTGISETKLLQLHDMVLDGYPTVAEAINHGKRSFDDFLKLLDRSQHFREWLHQMGPDADVVREYIQRLAAKEDWISSLPAKVVRYVLSSVVGLANPVAGMAIAAADMFLLERMARGWRPNHFMDGQLRPFLEEERPRDLAGGPLTELT